MVIRITLISSARGKMASTLKEVKLRWDLSTDEILKRTDELIERSKKVYDAIGALKPDQVTYQNCLKVKLLFCLKLFFVRAYTRSVHVCACADFGSWRARMIH